MVRTTPPRPRDLTAEFPELAALARPAVRLHPRRGTPTATDSSIGGPLLWPSGEPWPMRDEHIGEELTGMYPADLRLQREIADNAWQRDPESGPGQADYAQFNRVVERTVAVEGPVPMVAVAQLYARDVPQLPFPPGQDMLQVLWCPFRNHDRFEPRPSITWRSTADVVDALDPPTPEVVERD